MFAIYWKYKGYIGDCYWNKDEALVAKFAPGSRNAGAVKYFSWLTQRGFGPGYFNNSGVYEMFRKSVFKTEAEMNAALAIMATPMYSISVEVYKDDVAYADEVAKTRVHQKRMNKNHPY